MEGAVRLPAPSKQEIHRKASFELQNCPRFQLHNPLAKAKLVQANISKNNNFTQKAYGCWTGSRGWSNLMYPTEITSKENLANYSKTSQDFSKMLLSLGQTNSQWKIQQNQNFNLGDLGWLDYPPMAVRPPLPENLVAGQRSTSHRPISRFTPRIEVKIWG
jgi:hypothetical protein